MNGNGHVVAGDLPKPRGKPFEKGHQHAAKGTPAREAKLEGYMDRTWQAIVKAGPLAAERMVSFVTDGKGSMVGYLAAKDVLDRVLGQAKQRIEQSQADEFIQRMDALNAEMALRVAAED